MKTEYQHELAYLENFVLCAALTCITTMLYLLSVTTFS